MANTLRFKRGLASGLPTGVAGEPLFTTDTFDLYIGTGAANQRYQKYIASGTTLQYLRGDGSLATFPTNIITGTGVAGQVAYWSGASTQTGSNNLFWDATNTRLGILTNTPTKTFDVNGEALIRDTLNVTTGITKGINFASTRLSEPTNSSTFTQFLIQPSLGNKASVFQIAPSGTSTATAIEVYSNSALTAANRFVLKNTNGLLQIGADAAALPLSLISNNVNQFYMFGNGNIRLQAGGTFTDSGQRLQVTGDTLLKGSGNTSATTALRVQNSDTLQLFQILNNGNIGIPDASLSGYSLNINKSITGSIISAGIWQNGSVLADVTTVAIGIYNFLRIPAATAISSYQHFKADSAAFGAGGTLGTQVGFLAENSLTGATNNYGFYGNIASGTGRWNLYMNGTAANYLAGSLSIGTTANDTGYLRNYATIPVLALQNPTTGTAVGDGFQLSVSGALAYIWQYENSSMLFGTNATERMRLDASGNLGLGVVPSAWTVVKGLQIQRSSFTSYWDGVFASSQFTTNAYYNGSWRYIESYGAAKYDQQTNNQAHFWSIAPAGTAGNAITFTQAMTLFNTGNLAVGTTTDAGFRLDVNGTMRVSGASTFGGNMGLTLNQNANTTFTVTNTTSGTAAYSSFISVSNGGSYFEFGKRSTANTPYKTFAVGDAFVYNAINGDISILNDFASGSIKMAAGGSSTAHLTIASTGAATFSSSVTAASALLSSGGNGLSLAPGAIGFNRNVLTGAILNSGGFAYQWNKTNSTTNTSDLLDLQVYNTSGTFVTNAISFNGTGAATFGTSIQAATAIAIGTTPDTNKPFKILKNINATVGINFENTSTSANAFSAIQMGTDVTGGTAFTNLVYGSSGITQTGVYHPNGTSLINNGGGGLNFLGTPMRFYTGSSNGIVRLYLDNNGLTQLTATTPTTSETDGYKQYSADVVAGNAAPHFRTENGAVIKLYQETTGVGNAIFSQGGGTSVLDDSTFDGYTLRQIVKALRNQGILA